MAINYKLYSFKRRSMIIIIKYNKPGSLSNSSQPLFMFFLGKDKLCQVERASHCFIHGVYTKYLRLYIIPDYIFILPNTPVAFLLPNLYKLLGNYIYCMNICISMHLCLLIICISVYSKYSFLITWSN